ncbi:hypothetical protein EYZ11_004071 [Aspergillus tanneri]|uniref:Uncharacterized protein n=1 Tax=Aspergillus tanneri TaxID=1220188 RepID=A0A4S3JM38_9EURO|nr:hypothetical protein EYZ11_004071 [Aspergillus tanneri]
MAEIREPKIEMLSYAPVH